MIWASPSNLSAPARKSKIWHRLNHKVSSLHSSRKMNKEAHIMVKEADPPSTQPSAKTTKLGPGLPIGGNVAVKCPKCKELLVGRDWEKNLKVCPRCNYHFRLSAYERIAWLVDQDSFVETDREITASDPLQFVSPLQVYAQKVDEERKDSQLNEAVVIGHATIG